MLANNHPHFLAHFLVGIARHPHLKPPSEATWSQILTVLSLPGSAKHCFQGSEIFKLLHWPVKNWGSGEQLKLVDYHHTSEEASRSTEPVDEPAQAVRVAGRSRDWLVTISESTCLSTHGAQEVASSATGHRTRNQRRGAPSKPCSFGARHLAICFAPVRPDFTLYLRHFGPQVCGLWCLSAFQQLRMVTPRMPRGLYQDE